MNILFLHPNMPAQFKHLAPALARDARCRVVFATKRSGIEIPGVHRITYKSPREVSQNTHSYLRHYESAILQGQQIVRLCITLRERGFIPDLVVSHSGWGDPLFLRDILPYTKLVNYSEFYYTAFGGDAGFEEQKPLDIDAICRIRVRNAHLLQALDSCDAAITPTEWQKSRHPELFHSKISVIFDGVDTDLVRPNREARFCLPGGRELTRKDEVITYVSRNLEPYRGFPSFMRSLPDILCRRSKAEVVVVGGDEVSYGRQPPSDQTWREFMRMELGNRDFDRVHFVGRISYLDYLSLLQVSSVHLYLTVPFTLSWSCVEALASGCIVVGSRTPPVEEVIKDGENGLLVNFFEARDIADKVEAVLRDQKAFRSLGNKARELVLDKYSAEKCVRQQVNLLRDVTSWDFKI